MFTKAFISKIQGDTIYCISNGTSCMHCKNKLLCKKPDKPFEVRNTKNIDIKIGDMVELELDTRQTIISLLITLFIPLLSIIVSLILASKITNSPILLFLISLITASITLFIIYILNKKNKNKNTPIIVKNTKFNLSI